MVHINKYLQFRLYYFLHHTPLPPRRLVFIESLLLYGQTDRDFTILYIFIIMRATIASIFTVGVSYPFPQEKIILSCINEALPDLETGCCCGHFLKCICALKYNKHYGRQAARTKRPRQVGGLTQKSAIFYYCHLYFGLNLYLEKTVLFCSKNPRTRISGLMS